MIFSNSSCTIYLQRGPADYKRIVAERVLWEENPASANTISAKVYIDLDSVDLPIIRDDKPEERHYIVNGISYFRIIDAQTLKGFLANGPARTIKYISRRNFGFSGLHHWEVGAI